MEKTTVFAFGRNWAEYLENRYGSAVVDESIKYLKDFLGLSTLAGRTFLDVGSGSGIHSEAALLLDADRVVSIDADQDSVRCCEMIKDKKGYGDRWDIRSGSLLDEKLVREQGTHDIVYCWGVAHHTGGMYKGFDHLYQLTKPGGLLYVAIYNKVEGRLGSRRWWKIKHFYNHSNGLVKKLMEWGYLGWNFVKLVLHFQNPWRVMRNYPRKRGMSWRYDLIDWLGGYPYEYASVKEMFDYFAGKYGMELVNIKTTNYIGCNQFLFRKK